MIGSVNNFFSPTVTDPSDDADHKLNEESETDNVTATAEKSTDAFQDFGVKEIFGFARDWGSQLYQKVVDSGESAVNLLSDKVHLSDVGSSFRAVVEKVPVLKGFQRLQEDFVVEQRKERSSSTAESDPIHSSPLLPWHPDVSGLTDEAVSDKLRARILALSQNASTFLLMPPDEANVDKTVVSTPESVALAQAMLKEDPNLSKMRYELVPRRISEDRFWRNYFYRVSVVCQSFQLSALTGSGVDDYVCVDEDLNWGTGSTNEVESPLTEDTSSHPTVEQRTPNRKQSRRNTDHKSSDRANSKPTSNTGVSSADSGSVQTAPQQPDTSVANPTTQKIHRASDLIASDADLEAELDREVNEVVLINSTDHQRDELDRELELELLAELDRNHSPSST